jgi:hypothetical protein
VSKVATLYRNFPHTPPKDVEDAQALLTCAWRMLGDLGGSHVAPELHEHVSVARQQLAHLVTITTPAPAAGGAK